MSKKLYKKKIVITGGSSGIGLELSNYFLKNNYKIINIDVKKK